MTRKGPRILPGAPFVASQLVMGYDKRSGIYAGPGPGFPKIPDRLDWTCRSWRV